VKARPQADVPTEGRDCPGTKAQARSHATKERSDDWRGLCRAKRGQPEQEAGGGTSVSELTFREQYVHNNYKTNGLVVETSRPTRHKCRPVVSEYQLVGDNATKEGLDASMS